MFLAAAPRALILFLSTLSLRRATTHDFTALNDILISIHALLAESDEPGSCSRHLPQRFLSTLSLRRATAYLPFDSATPEDFYPRSPCGERRVRAGATATNMEFLSTLSCGERLVRLAKLCEVALFLSTLSLRRATWGLPENSPGIADFYPRSPCGERRPPKPHKQVPALFLSTLSLRRATIRFQISQSGITNFYPRSPCGERPNFHRVRYNTVDISIHALLAESDRHLSQLIPLHSYFYPRSPCGERLGSP